MSNKPEILLLTEQRSSDSKWSFEFEVYFPFEREANLCGSAMNIWYTDQLYDTEEMVLEAAGKVVEAMGFDTDDRFDFRRSSYLGLAAGESDDSFLS